MRTHVHVPRVAATPSAPAAPSPPPAAMSFPSAFSPPPLVHTRQSHTRRHGQRAHNLHAVLEKPDPHTQPAALPESPAPTPLLDAVTRESRRVRANFFAPGHKCGALLHPSLHALAPAFALDLPELPGIGELSSSRGLHGPIGQAETLYAARFPGYTTRFLTGGSTAGVLAAVLATTTPGMSVLLPRNVHQSAVHALVLAGATPVWLAPEIDVHGLLHTVRARDVRDKLAAAQRDGVQVAAVLVVSPTYHGVVADVKGIAEVCGGVRLIVDEAHGAHFGLCDGLPESAARMGADVVVQSVHKTLPVLTAGAVVHVRVRTGLAERIEGALRIVCTTSPSALVLVAIDAARAMLDDGGEEMAAATVRQARRAVGLLREIKGVRVLGREDVGEGGVGIDPMRVTVLMPEGVSGYAVDEALIEEFGVYVELPALRSITLVFALPTTDGEVEVLVEALRVVVSREMERCGREGGEMVGRRVEVGMKVGFGEMGGITPREAFFARAEIVPVESAVGRVSADTLCPYPPGIPVVVPGERFEREGLLFLREVLRSGGNVSGAVDAELAQVRVLCEDEVQRLTGRRSI